MFRATLLREVNVPNSSSRPMIRLNCVSAHPAFGSNVITKNLCLFAPLHLDFVISQRAWS